MATEGIKVGPALLKYVKLKTILEDCVSFRLDLVNRAGLFRNYASWHESGNNWSDLGHLNMAHGLSSIVYALERIFLLKKECVDQYVLFEGSYKWSGSETLFRSPSIFDLFSSYSTFLLGVRLAQNSLLNILSKELCVSMPQSMNGVVSSKKKNAIPKDIFDLIVSYWNVSGFELKQYRDLDQHYGLVARDAWVVRSSRGVDLKVYLPDDPKIQSESKFTFALKRDAFSYADKAFEDFHSLVNNISVTLGYKDERDFDYNMVMPIDHGVAVYITSDPYQKKLCAREMNFTDGAYVIHESIKGFDGFSFIKLNERFPVKHKFYREVLLSGKLEKIDDSPR